MFVDVSEVKSYRGCKRAWKLGSRNQYHLRPKVQPKAFAFGTLFHNALHKLYLGQSLDSIIDYLYQITEKDEWEEKDVKIILNMIIGYDREVMPTDRERFHVLDIEHRFSFTAEDYVKSFIKQMDGEPWSNPLELVPLILRDVEIGGSIDMMCLEVATNKIWAFEHKTAKSFRKPAYLWLDEQPRLYSVATQMWIDKLNTDRYEGWKYDVNDRGPEPEPYTLGGVYINEVKKNVRDFDYQRSALVYPDGDRENFMTSFFSTVEDIVTRVEDSYYSCPPQPDFMKCSNCQYAPVCEKFMYSDPPLDMVLESFGDTMAVREVDHLEEKDADTIAGA